MPSDEIPMAVAKLVMLKSKGRPQQNICIKLPKITNNVVIVFNILNSVKDH